MLTCGASPLFVNPVKSVAIVVLLLVVVIITISIATHEVAKVVT